MNFRMKLFASAILLSCCAVSYAQITTPIVTNDQNNLYFSYVESLPASFYQVFIDKDMNAATGYSIGGMGADRLIENTSSYQFVGPGWNWSALQNVVFNNTSALKSWTVPLSVLGLPAPMFCSTPIEVIYRAVFATGTFDITPIINYNIVLTSNCVGISNEKAGFSNTQFSFSFQVGSAQTYNRIYIDTTQDASTGFPVAGIGAKYLLENKNLYAYVGPGWNWKLLKTETFSDTNNIVSWAIGRNDIGNSDCAGAFNYVGQIQTGTTINTGAKQTLSYPADTQCAGKTAIAVPSYFYPCTGANCSWTLLDSSIPKVGIAVINPASGSGPSANPDYLTQTKTTQALGGTVLGYVDTNYGNINLAAVEANIDNYYNWYKVDGIFFDEGYSANCNLLSYYETLNQYVKAKGGKGVTIVNYGVNPPECYTAASDILINFEGSYSSYLTWSPASWVTGFPQSKFYQIIYNTPQTNVANAVQLAKTRYAGWVFVTSLNLPNPYASMPSAAYWQLELGALS